MRVLRGGRGFGYQTYWITHRMFLRKPYLPNLRKNSGSAPCIRVVLELLSMFSPLTVCHTLFLLR